MQPTVKDSSPRVTADLGTLRNQLQQLAQRLREEALQGRREATPVVITFAKS